MDWIQRTGLGIGIIGFSIFLAQTLYSNKVRAGTAGPSQSGDSKKPDVQQRSEGPNSPNTVVIGNNNTVINNSDPRVSRKLDELLKLARKQGSATEPEKLLAKYPLGYVIFDIDKRNDVFPYATQSLLENWDFDWGAVKMTEQRINNQDMILLRLPNIRPRNGHGLFMTGPQSIAWPQSVGPMGASILHTPQFDMRAEILAIGSGGVVFLIGFARP